MGTMICTDEKLTPQGSDLGESSNYFSYYDDSLSFNKTFHSTKSYDINKIRFATIQTKNVGSSKNIIPSNQFI
jgi:hypothetical protein